MIAIAKIAGFDYSHREKAKIISCSDQKLIGAQYSFDSRCTLDQTVLIDFEPEDQFCKEINLGRLNTLLSLYKEKCNNA